MNIIEFVEHKATRYHFPGRNPFTLLKQILELYSKEKLIQYTPMLQEHLTVKHSNYDAPEVCDQNCWDAIGSLLLTIHQSELDLGNDTEWLKQCVSIWRGPAKTPDQPSS
jgi:hypothetical protein